MTTLDGVERTFDAETVLVCDRDGPSGIAGIMGGAASEVSESTTRVLLEVATWNGVNILRTSRRLGPALGRVEPVREAAPPRARDPGAADRLEADGRAVRGEARPGHDRRSRRDPADRTGVGLRTARAESLLGMRDRARALRRPTSSGSASGSSGTATSSTAEVPVHRHYDVTREADLIEEVGRIHGYDDPPAGDASRGDRPGRPADARAGAAPPRRGRDARPRLRRASSR